MVAVKGMEMPKNCMDCPLFDGEYGDCNIIVETKADATEERAENCPLVEIVTCKDCKYWLDDGNSYCGIIGNFTDKDFYCGAAKRRE